MIGYLQHPEILPARRAGHTDDGLAGSGEVRPRAREALDLLNLADYERMKRSFFIAPC